MEATAKGDILMATGEMLAERAEATSDEFQTGMRGTESVADRICICSAMGGVVFGVIAGAILGHAITPGFPEVIGALGGILGGLVASLAGQCVFLPAWNAHRRKHPLLHPNPAAAFRDTATPTEAKSPHPADGTSHPDITAS
jgi:hypothetical protein